MKHVRLLTGLLILIVTPLVIGINKMDSTSVAASSNGDLLPEITNCTIQTDISYAEDASPYHKMNVYLPVGNGPFPAFIYVHGGGWVEGSRGTYDHLGPFYAKRGIAGFSIDYTLATENKTSWPVVIRDVIRAIRYVKANAQQCRIDPERIALMGDSAGGHLASLAGLLSGNEPFLEGASGNPEVSSRVCLVVDYYGPTDLQFIGESEESTAYWITAAFLGDVPYMMNQSLWLEASPSTYITGDAPVFFIVHGTNDTVVPIAISESFKTKLEAAGVETHFVQIEGGDHSILTNEGENLKARYALEPLLKRVFNLQQGEAEFSALIILSLTLTAALLLVVLFKRKRNRTHRQIASSNHSTVNCVSSNFFQLSRRVSSFPCKTVRSACSKTRFLARL
jgi:acetyl esterase/lipase